MRIRVAPVLLLATTTAVLVGLRPAPADEQGKALLRAAFKKLHAAKSYGAELTQTLAPMGVEPLVLKGRLAAAKPNLLSVRLTGKIPMGPDVNLSLVSDGKFYFQHQGGPTYSKDEVDANPTQFQGRWEAEVDAFFGGEGLAEKRDATVSGTATVNGVACDLVKLPAQEDGPAVEYAIGKQDGFIHRTTLTFGAGTPRQMVLTNTLTGITLNPAHKPETFAFTPPPGAREQFAKMIPVGKPAPDFNLPVLKGGRVALSDLRKGKKAVLVNFWFYN
ncbi:MAG: redoxin domain-containing protein [Armatimonadetes bacterium]|nr:redoxin domain-containing protein [Armatimonadota bacterium]